MGKLSKSEKAAMKAQRKEELALKKKKKIEEKEHKKEIERLNRMLSPVSRKTFNSMGLIAFNAKDATIRKIDNEWVKTYKIEGMNSANRDEFIDSLASVLSIRARISSHFSPASTGKLIRTDYITFFVSAEIYETVKNLLDAEVQKINSISVDINIVEISLNCYMNQIRRNFQYDGPEMDYEHLTKKKNDWKTLAYRDIVVSDDYFKVNNHVGACLQVIQFPNEIQENILESVLELGAEINKPMMFITDLRPYTDEENEGYKRVLEKKFNTTIDEFENDYVNAGLTMIIITDSLLQKEELVDAMENKFCDNAMVVSPVYGNTADVLESSFSYGLRDYHSMRNIKMNQVKQLIV